MKKPDTCRSCPWYDDGKGFVPDEPATKPRVLLLLQNPGEDEEDAGQPAIGKTGQYLNTQLIPLSGLTRGKDLQVGNALRCRWRNPATGRKTNDLPTKGDSLQRALQHCEQYTKVAPSVELIVTAGDPASRHYGKLDGTVTDWRGFFAPMQYRNRPVYTTLHPASLFHNHRMILPSKVDWSKIKRILAGTWPSEVPLWDIIEDAVFELPALEASALRAPYIVCDTEYIVSRTGNDNTLTLAGFLWPQGSSVKGFQLPWRNMTAAQRNVSSAAIRGIMRQVPVVFHNAMADIPVLTTAMGIQYPGDYKQVDDTMLAHGILHSEWPHDLGFLESMYGDHNKMKHLRTDPMQQFLYNWGDCLSTNSAWVVIEKELRRDTQTARLYREQSLALIEPLLEAKARGVRLDHKFLTKRETELQDDISYASTQAQAYAGWDINLGSRDHVFAMMQAEGIKPKKKKGKLSLDDDAVAELRRTLHDYNPDDEVNGISQELCEKYLADMTCPEILTLRAMYQGVNTLVTHYFNPLRDPQTGLYYERVYPDQLIHTQTSGRWSTVDPPLATLPSGLRAMLVPDPGWGMVGFDKDQIELRLLAAITGDTPTLEAFANGWDVHTLNFCDFFQVPHPPNKIDPHRTPECEAWRQSINWEGKDDIRRVFSKTFVYRLNYRGQPESSGDVPGARTLGLKKQHLVQCAMSYLKKHPAISTYWRQVDAQVLSTRMIRTPWGRRRYLNGPGGSGKGKIVPAICREGTNHPYQGGTSDHFNDLLLRIWRSGRSLPLIWVTGAHDSQKWTFPLDKEQQALDIIDYENSVPMELNGMKVNLPATRGKVVYG